MESDTYIRFVLALVFVLGLLGLAAWLLRRAGYGNKIGRTRRLASLETLPLGPRHRLMLIRRDDVEHLLLLGPEGDTVVERNIPVTSGRSAARPVPAQRKPEPDDLMEEEYGREPTFSRGIPERTVQAQPRSGESASGAPAAGVPGDRLSENRFAELLRGAKERIARESPSQDDKS